MSKLLLRYIFFTYLRTFGMIVLASSALVFLLELIEVQRAGVLATFGFGRYIIIACLRIPTTLARLMPLLVFVTTAVAIGRLSFNNELFVLRSLGLSAWRICIPIVLAAGILQTLNLCVWHPVGLALTHAQEALKKQRVKQPAHDMFTIFSNGVWVKTNLAFGYLIMHAKYFDRSANKLETVVCTAFSESGVLQQCEYAKRAYIRDGKLVMRKGWRFKPQHGITSFEKSVRPYAIRLDELLLQNVNPEYASVWTLMSLRSKVKNAGVSAYRYDVRWHRLLGTLLECMGLALLGVFLGSQWSRRASRIWVGASLTGGVSFLVYFFTQLAGAVALGQQYAAWLVGWGPALGLCCVAALTLLLLEEGMVRHF